MMDKLIGIMAAYLLIKLVVMIWIGFKISKVHQELFYTNRFLAGHGTALNSIARHIFDIRCDIREHFLNIARNPENDPD